MHQRDWCGLTTRVKTMAFGWYTIPSLASLVKRAHPSRVVSLRAHHLGGKTFSCVDGRCGVHRVAPTSTVVASRPVVDLEPSAQSGNARLHLGELTPSPPQVGEIRGDRAVVSAGCCAVT